MNTVRIAFAFSVIVIATWLIWTGVQALNVNEDRAVSKLETQIEACEAELDSLAFCTKTMYCGPECYK